MALKAGYYGIKKNIKNRLEKVLQYIPSSASADNPIATKDDVLASVTLLDDTVGWLGGNMLVNNASSGTSGGVTRTVNDDKSISLGGIAESSVTGTINTFTGAQLKAMGDKLVLSGGVSSDIYLTLRLQPWSIVYADRGNGVVIDTSTLDNAVTYYLSYAINQGANTDGKVLYPMILTEEQYALNPAYRQHHNSVAEELLAMQPKTATFSGSTSANGNIKISDTPLFIIAVNCAYCADSYIYTGGQYLHFTDASSTYTIPAEGTTVTGTYLYYDIPAQANRELQAAAPEVKEIADEPVVEKTTTKRTTKKSAKVEEE